MTKPEMKSAAHEVALVMSLLDTFLPRSMKAIELMAMFCALMDRYGIPPKDANEMLDAVKRAYALGVGDSLDNSATARSREAYLKKAAAEKKDKLQ